MSASGHLNEISSDHRCVHVRRDAFRCIRGASVTQPCLLHLFIDHTSGWLGCALAAGMRGGMSSS
jgi:hypothetical protein